LITFSLNKDILNDWDNFEKLLEICKDESGNTNFSYVGSLLLKEYDSNKNRAKKEYQTYKDVKKLINNEDQNFMDLWRDAVGLGDNEFQTFEESRSHSNETEETLVRHMDTKDTISKLQELRYKVILEDGVDFALTTFSLLSNSINISTAKKAFEKLSKDNKTELTSLSLAIGEEEILTAILFLYQQPRHPKEDI